VLIDPLPLSAHDEQHLRELGGAQWIVVTNSSHVRGAKEMDSD
jgi:metallo-beta-lactamase superfamily protein